jgi:hypothetical protein
VAKPAAVKAQTPKVKVAPAKPKVKKVKGKGKFVLDLSDPVEDGIMDPNSFVRSLSLLTPLNGIGHLTGPSLQLKSFRRSTFTIALR